MPHVLSEMVKEAMKLYAGHLDNIIATMRVCMMCRLQPIEVIYRPPTFDISLVPRPILEDGLPAANPFYSADMELSVTYMLQLLCSRCAADYEKARADHLDRRRQNGTLVPPIIGDVKLIDASD